VTLVYVCWGGYAWPHAVLHCSSSGELLTYSTSSPSVSPPTLVHKYNRRCTEGPAAAGAYNVLGSWGVQQQQLSPCIPRSLLHLQQWPVGCPVRGYAKGKGVCLPSHPSALPLSPGASALQHSCLYAGKGRQAAADEGFFPPPIYEEGEEPFSLSQYET
jgi:hypothetical protein